MANMTKDKHIKAFQNNLGIEVSIVLECTTCGSKIVEEAETDDFEDISVENMANKLALRAYNKGWRQATSKALNQIGIMCAKCYENRDSSKYFDNL